MGREPFTLSTSTSCLSSPSSCLPPTRSTLSPPERTLPTRRQPSCNQRTSLSSSAVSTSLQSLLVQNIARLILYHLLLMSKTGRHSRFIIFTSQEMILLLLLLLFSSFYMFKENFISAILLRQDLKKNLPRPVHTSQLYFNIGSIHQKMKSGSTNC